MTRSEYAAVRERPDLLEHPTPAEQPRCERCGEPLVRNGPGRKSPYCSRSCREKAARARRRKNGGAQMPRAARKRGSPASGARKRTGQTSLHGAGGNRITDPLSNMRPPEPASNGAAPLSLDRLADALGSVALVTFTTNAGAELTVRFDST